MPVMQENEVEKKSLLREFGGALLLHVIVIGGIALSGFVFHQRSQRWGENADLSGAVQATMVSSIPLPPRVRPREDNVLASEHPSEAPPQPTTKAEPPPKPTDIPVQVRQPDKKESKRVAERPTPETPKQKQPPPPEPQKATSGSTGGVKIAMQAMQSRIGTSAVNVTDQSFGARFGYYVRQMNQRISQQWFTQTLDTSAQGRRVYLTFRISRDGSISEINIVKGSGNASLDSSANRALQRIDSLGPLPDAYSGSYITVQYYFEPSQQ